MNTLKNKRNDKALLIIAALLLAALYWVRVINLDQDLPPWGVGLYQPKDEGCYAILAVNEMEYGQINPENPLLKEGLGPMYVQEHIRVNYLGNLLEILSFRLFGDNYYGLRSPMLLIGFCNLCVMALVLLQLRKRYGKGESDELWMILGLLMLMSTHFYSYLSSRTVEPSTLRMLFAQLVFLAWLKLQDRRRLCFFVMGMLITASVFLVYITNVFLYLAVGILLIMIGATEGWKNFWRGAIWFVLGIVPVFFAAEIYYRTVWDSSVISNTLGIFGTFKDLSGYTVGATKGVSSFVKGLVLGFVRYMSANWFLYAPALLFAVMVLFLPGLYTLLKKKDKTLCLMLAVPFSMLLQTMLSEDYIVRKLLVVVPYFLYQLMWWFMFRDEIEGLRGKWMASCEKISNRTGRALAKYVLYLYPMICAFLTICFVLYRIKITGDDSKLDFTSIDKLLLMFIGCMPILIWLVARIVFEIRKKRLPIIASVCLLGCTTLLLSGVFLAKYVFINPTYKERDMQISLSEKYDLDGRYVISDFAMGITLYNDLKPIYDHHENYGARMISNPDLLLCHYATSVGGMRSYIDKTIFHPWSAYSAREIEIIPGTFQTFGETRDFALYEAAPRSKILAEEREEFYDSIFDQQNRLEEIEQDNSGLDVNDLYNAREAIGEKTAEEMEFDEGYYRDYRGSVTTPLYVDVYGSIYGDVMAPIYGRVYGDIYGDIRAPIYGDIYGEVFGNVYVECPGSFHSAIHGEFLLDDSEK